MRIAALVKVVPDYNVPLANFELMASRAHEKFTRMIGMYDENAVELAAQLKAKHGGEMVVVSYGQDDTPILRKALAMGGDRLVLVEGRSDELKATASNLFEALKGVGEVDLVLTGVRSSDLGRGIVPGMVADLLGIPFVSNVITADKGEDGWTVKQMTEGGSRTVLAGPKCVISVTNGPENLPRIPPVKDIMASKKKPVDKMPCIQTDGAGAREISVQLQRMEYQCEMLPVGDLREASKTLLRRLAEGNYL